MDSTIWTLAGFEARPGAISSTSWLEIEQLLLLSFLNSGLRGSTEDVVQEEVCVGADGVGAAGDVDGDGVVDGGVDGVGVSEVV